MDTAAVVPGRALPASKEQANGEAPGANRGVSIVIPAYNEENGVAGVVAHIREVLTRAGWAHEVVVVVGEGIRDRARLDDDRALVRRIVLEAEPRLDRQRVGLGPLFEAAG